MLASDFDERDRAVSWIAKRNEMVRVALTSFKGHEGVDIRICYLDADGTWQPGPKGAWFPVETFPELELALQAVRDELDGKGERS